MKKETDEKGNPLSYWGGLQEPKQETAVDWLLEKYVENSILSIKDFEQAKEMEKQQIIDARNNGYESTYNSCESGCMGSMIIEGSHEQYYNQTYNNETTNNH
jgi:acetylglutamate kinase